MKYFKNSEGNVFGYDETEKTQLPYIEAAINAGWIDVSNSWPPQTVEPPHAPPSPAKVLADLLVSKGVVTQSEIDTVASENGVVFSDQ